MGSLAQLGVSTLATLCCGGVVEANILCWSRAIEIFARLLHSTDLREFFFRFLSLLLLLISTLYFVLVRTFVALL